MNAEIIEIVLKIAGLIFAVGVIYGKMKSFASEMKDFRKEYKEDMKALTNKVEKHNNFDRRIVALETAIEIYHAQERARELQK